MHLILWRSFISEYLGWQRSTGLNRFALSLGLLFLFQIAQEGALASDRSAGRGPDSDPVQCKADGEMLARDVRQDMDPAGLIHLHVLAFHDQVDSRPVRTQCVLVLTQMKRGYWELWLMARNPRSDGKPAKWTQYTITDSTQRGWKSFKNRPNASEITIFLKESGWTWALATPTFRTINHKIFRKQWKCILGFEPSGIVGL